MRIEFLLFTLFAINLPIMESTNFCCFGDVFTNTLDYFVDQAQFNQSQYSILYSRLVEYTIDEVEKITRLKFKKVNECKKKCINIKISNCQLANCDDRNKVVKFCLLFYKANDTREEFSKYEELLTTAIVKQSCSRSIKLVTNLISVGLLESIKFDPKNRDYLKLSTSLKTYLNETKEWKCIED